MQAAFFGLQIRDKALDDADYGLVINIGRRLFFHSEGTWRALRFRRERKGLSATDAWPKTRSVIGVEYVNAKSVPAIKQKNQCDLAEDGRRQWRLGIG
jgi:hypothetical protein